MLAGLIEAGILHTPTTFRLTIADEHGSPFESNRRVQNPHLVSTEDDMPFTPLGYTVSIILKTRVNKIHTHTW